MNENPAALLIILAVAVLTGCTAPRPPLVVTDPDPSVKIPAIKIAVDRKDRKAVAQLVEDLESDDPAVRFYAIEGLEKLTGQTFEYRYYEDADERQPAVKRWQEWLSEKETKPPKQEPRQEQ